jgi:hypothetical protein
LALGKQDFVLALPGAASADAIRLRDLPREYLAPSMQQLHGLCKRDSAEAKAGSGCLLWLDSLASLASLLADEEVPKDTEAQLVQLAAGWPALCAIQAKAMKVTEEGGSANKVAEAKRRVMVSSSERWSLTRLPRRWPTWRSSCAISSCGTRRNASPGWTLW